MILSLRRLLWLSVSIKFPLIVALLVACESAQAGQFTFRTVALAGHPAPGTSAGVTYSGFDPTVRLNVASETTFYAYLAGPDVTEQNREGLWFAPPTGAALLARLGDQAPGTPAGVNYNSFSSYLGPAPGSQSSFYLFLTGPGITVDNNGGLWVGTPGAVSLLARSGDQAPGGPAGIVFVGLSVPKMNASGQSAFVAGLGGPGITPPNLGIWRGTPGNLTLVTRTGEPASGTPAGVTYGIIRTFSLRFNAAGQIGFKADLKGPGITTNNGTGFWVGEPGGLALLARTGDAAPGTPLGTNYSNFSDDPPLNSGGQATFLCDLTGPGITNTNNSGLWTGSPGNVMLLARESDPAPGMAAGISYYDFGNPPVIHINASGQSLFAGYLAGPGVSGANGTALWTGTPGAVVNVVREGDAAPGAGAGTVFGRLSYIYPFALNDRGQIAFQNKLTGPNVTTTNDGSLWLSDSEGALTLVAREGQAFLVGPGDSRILEELNFTGGSGDEDGLGSGLSDNGQVVFFASFTDGSQGLFIATPALQLATAFSRKIHGGLTAFDINLPLTGEPGVECRRSGGNHTLVFLFNNDVVSGNAGVTSGIGTVSGSPTFTRNSATVTLSGVTDVQKITVTLSDVTDSFGQILPDTSVSMNLLAGDTNGNKTVNGTDVSQTKAQSGQPVTAANFRQDVTPNGSINTSDIGLVKSRSGQSVP